MDLKQLRYFARIAETGNFREAARRLHVAQSALSRQVGLLEADLGVALFERHPRGVTLTPSGTRLFEHARRLLRDAETARLEVRAGGDGLTGRVGFGTTGAMGRLLFARLTERLSAAAPGVALDLSEGRTHRLLEGIETGALDLALVTGVEPRSDIVLKPLVTDQLYLVARWGETALPDGTIQVRDLGAWPLVTFKRPSGPRMTLERAAVQAQTALTFLYEVDSFDVIKDFVARGMGYGVLPHSSIYGDLGRETLRAIPIEGLSLTRMTVSHADRPAAPAAQEVERLIGEEMATLRAEGVFA